MKSLSHVRLLATPWTTAYQAPLSMGSARQEYWSGLPSSSPICIANQTERLSRSYIHRGLILRKLQQPCLVDTGVPLGSLWDEFSPQGNYPQPKGAALPAVVPLSLWSSVYSDRWVWGPKAHPCLLWDISEGSYALQSL